MSKVSSNYPSYSSSSIGVGNSTAKTGVKDGILTSDYDMSDSEASIYNYALSTIASILPQLNTFDTDTQNSILSQVNAYKEAGIEDINEIYNPMITNLENDIVSRFGNLDSSIFTDNLGNIESKRSDAVSSFAQDVLAKQSELESDELTKRYALVEFLNGLSNNIYDNALETVNVALGGSSSLNSYNSQLYDALSALESTNSGSSNTTSSLLTNLLALTGNSSLSSLLSGMSL